MGRFSKTLKSAGGKFETDGWTRLPFRLNQNELANLSNLKPHIGRGVRLTNMQVIENALPAKFKNYLADLGFHPSPNRAVGFVKSEEFNWSLPWHQDRVIAMPQKIESPDYSNWTRKPGIWHCEPSEGILKEMAFTYIAFDEIKDGDGGLELAVGTHIFGKIHCSEINPKVARSKIVIPDMTVGEILLISALTLHRSTLWSGKGQRRGLRLDFIPREYITNL